MRSILFGLAGLILAAGTAAQAAPETNSALPPLAEAGTLTCSIAPGVGLFLGSSRTAACVFDHPGPFSFSETYTATLSRVGIDLGVMNKEAVKWAVYTPGGAANPGLLAGLHPGASAETALIAGAGAQISFDNSGAPVVLRQVSSTTGPGLGVGLGETSLSLASAAGQFEPPAH